MKKIVILALMFFSGTIVFAQYVPRDLLTSDPAQNRAIAEAIQKYGEKAVREALAGSQTQSQNSGYQNNSYQSGYSGNQERIIQGAYSYNGQTAIVMLRYSNGNITAYSTSQDQLGRYNWQSMYPDNPHPTNSTQDGMAARNYKYKVAIGNTWVYFNL